MALPHRVVVGGLLRRSLGTLAACKLPTHGSAARLGLPAGLPGLADDRPVALRQRASRGVGTLAGARMQQWEQPRRRPCAVRGVASSAAATNPIKAKIKGSLVEARVRNVRVCVLLLLGPRRMGRVQLPAS